VAQTRTRFGAAPSEIEIGGAIGQGRRGHEETMRRLRHQRRKRDTRIDPIPVDADIGLQPVDPVER